MGITVIIITKHWHNSFVGSSQDPIGPNSSNLETANNTLILYITLYRTGVALAKRGHDHGYDYYEYWGLESPHGKDSSDDGDKVWRFHLGDNLGGNEYL